MTDILEKEQNLERLIEFQQDAPVKVTPIADAFGLKVFRTTEFPDWISGKILKDPANGGKSGYAIYVNAKHSLGRRRFTIAHEIAHFILHKEKIGDGLIDDGLYRSGLSGKEEIEANKLAADILMPRNLINKYLALPNFKDLQDMADKFEVSKNAMAIRLGIPNEA